MKGRKMISKDLEALMDYGQDDENWLDFRDYLCDDGQDFLTKKELKIMRETDWDKHDYQEVIDKQTDIMQKVAMTKKCDHIWAVAERVRNAG